VAADKANPMYMSNEELGEEEDGAGYLDVAADGGYLEDE